MARKQLRCLMVGRDRLLMDLWRAAWSADNMLVACSTSIEEARHEMGQQEYDIVVIDLPIELAAKLADTQSRCATPFVVLVEENTVLPQPLPPAISTFSRSAPLEELLHAIRNTLWDCPNRRVPRKQRAGSWSWMMKTRFARC